jgi:hypothetical protein
MVCMLRTQRLEYVRSSQLVVLVCLQDGACDGSSGCTCCISRFLPCLLLELRAQLL